MSIQKQAIKPLQFKIRKSRPIHRLPFVGKEKNAIGASFWAVPKTGGYRGGCQTGEALALIYLKHLKEHACETGLTSLQRIALDMFDCEFSDSPELSALRGQAVGFFSVLEQWITAAAKHLDGGLDKHDSKALLKVANTGLNLATGA